MSSAPRWRSLLWPLGLTLLTFGWGALVRVRSETWWWVSVLDLLPPQVWAPLPLWWAVQAARRHKNWELSLSLLALAALLGQAGWTWHPVQTSDARPLTILSLNADFASAPAAQVAALARREGADPLLIQEGLTRQRDTVTYAAALRRALPGWHFAQHDELLSFSRLPLLEAGPVTFPHSPHALLWMRVRWDGQVLNIYNVHLTTNGLLPSRSDTRLGRTLPQRVSRRLQVKRDFLSLVTGQLRRPGPALFVGDFNAPPRGELAARLRVLGLQDAFAVAGSGFGFTHAAQFGHSRIDYVWESGLQVDEARALPDRLSDHRALLVRLSSWR
ncbi:endonuclease/exonuclease/phosphatase family protein [Deinococcus sp. PESE-13]